MSWIDFLGFAAALSVLASFSMSTILALRTLALLSNVLFILYGLRSHLPRADPSYNFVSH